MNSDQQKDGQNNEYRHQNHSVSCNCGCQQDKYEYEQKQSREKYNNKYMSNEQTQNDEGMGYPVANEVMRNDMYDSVKKEFRAYNMCHENKNYYSFSSRQFNTFTLPEESQRFQTITSHLSSEKRGFDALRTRVGQQLGQGLSNYCRNVTVQNQVTNDYVHDDGNRQRFLFYSTDSGQFIIANQQFGEVLEYVDTGESIVTRLYNGNPRQFFRKVNASTDRFRLMIDNDMAIAPCGNLNNLTRMTGFEFANNDTELFYHQTDQNVSITIPALSTPTELGPPPVLTSLSDAGPSPEQATRAVIGSALIPCIFVNDVLPLDRRIQESPYYKLEYRQYWHRLWTDEISSGDRRLFDEITGIPPNAQINMRNMIDITIGADWGLRFGNNSTPFKRGILNGLNTLGSYANTDLGDRFANVTQINFNAFSVRYARFVIAHEYRLTRSNGQLVTTPWVALDHRLPQTARFPLNAQSLQNYKIISSYNSYDLPVLENTDNNNK
ncbi:hypothetical protein [Bacillus sp. FSL L8-0152]|uniref:hypothetical protein n=1 Tax=Bacillus sp. FSL L8-0152 TaxID=2921516 RepID=UPI0030F72F1E